MHVEAHDTLEELQGAIKLERNGRTRDRIRGVVLARKGRTAKEVAADLSVSPRAVQDWVRAYNAGGLKNLPDAPRSGPPRRCPRAIFEPVRKRILDGPRPGDKVCTLRGRDVQRILREEFNIVQKLSTTYELMHELGLSPLRPRPRHRKNNPDAMKVWEERAPLLSRPSVTPTPTRRSRSGSRTKPASASKAR
jgi:transposase